MNKIIFFIHLFFMTMSITYGQERFIGPVLTTGQSVFQKTGSFGFGLRYNSLNYSKITSFSVSYINMLTTRDANELKFRGLNLKGLKGKYVSFESKDRKSLTTGFLTGVFLNTGVPEIEKQELKGEFGDLIDLGLSCEVPFIITWTDRLTSNFGLQFDINALTIGKEQFGSFNKSLQTGFYLGTCFKL